VSFGETRARGGEVSLGPPVGAKGLAQRDKVTRKVTATKSLIPRKSIALG